MFRKNQAAVHSLSNIFCFQILSYNRLQRALRKRRDINFDLLYLHPKKISFSNCVTSSSSIVERQRI